MDTLLLAFDSSTRVSFDELDTFSKHPRFSQYKEKVCKSDQKARITKFLEEQKRKKSDVLNLFRGVSFDCLNEVEAKLSTVDQTTTSKRIYKDFLMMSEWLIEVPDDFLTNWIAVPCPIGKRVLVVAEKGTTVAYSRKGFTVLHKFPSALPGGSKMRSKKCTTMLDCIWSEVNRTLYILDLIQWGPNLTECPSEFRFAWLDWKLKESNDECSTFGRYNKYKLMPLERFPCERLPEYASTQFPLEEESIAMDGIVFFHKDGFYLDHDRSPLVTWLKPYMLTEILGITVHPSYERSRPNSQMETNSDEARNGTEEATSENVEMDETNLEKGHGEISVMDGT